jgi:hypothetical protein
MIHLTLQRERPGRLRSASLLVRILDAVDELLFNDGELRLALEAQVVKLREAVEAEPEESLKQADAEEWAEALAHHFAVACPELTGDVWMEEAEDVKIDISDFPGRRYFSDPHSELARNFPGHRVVVHVPFEGDDAVFHLRPNQFNFNPPRANIGDQELTLPIEWVRDEEPNIDNEVNAFVGSVSTWLTWAKGEIDTFNANLSREAVQAITARRQRIEQRDAEIAKSSIPVRRPGESEKTYIPDVLVRRPVPSLPQTRADEEPPKLEPAIEERVFEHILGVIRMQGRQMEQNPGAYEGMGEEDRRHTLVATLNTHYEGRAAAEAFNYQGKTDILIRFEGRNLFICECKFWSGQEGFKETIDQLFRYAAWRDSKLAIVLFVRVKGLKPIIEKAQAALSEHPQFVEWKEAADQTELRATMRWPGEEERFADLNVLFIHTPETRS